MAIASHNYPLSPVAKALTGLGMLPVSWNSARVTPCPRESAARTACIVALIAVLPRAIVLDIMAHDDASIAVMLGACPLWGGEAPSATKSLNWFMHSKNDGKGGHNQIMIGKEYAMSATWPNWPNMNKVLDALTLRALATAPVEVAPVVEDSAPVVEGETDTVVDVTPEAKPEAKAKPRKPRKAKASK